MQAAFALQVTEAAVRWLGETPASTAATKASSALQQGNACMGVGGQSITGSCRAMLWAVLSLHAECNANTPVQEKDGNQFMQSEQQLLQAVCSLCATYSKAQQQLKEPAAVAGLQIAVEVLKRCQQATKRHSHSAVSQQQQHVVKSLEAPGQDAATAAAASVVGRYLLAMGAQVQSNSPSGVKLPEWALKLCAGPAQQQQKVQEQQRHGHDHVVKVMELVMFDFQQVLADWQDMVSVDEWRMHMSAQVLLQPLLSLSSTPQAQDLAAKRLECAKNAAGSCCKALSESLAIHTNVTGSYHQRQESHVPALEELRESLQEAGQALLLVSHSSGYCSNPSCRSLATVSDGFALVRAKECVCAGCLAVPSDGSGNGAAGTKAARWVSATGGYMSRYARCCCVLCSALLCCQHTWCITPASASLGVHRLLSGCACIWMTFHGCYLSPVPCALIPPRRYCSRACQAAHRPVHKDICGWRKQTQSSEVASQSVAGSTKRVHSGTSTTPAPGSTETEAFAYSEDGTCRHTDSSGNSVSTARAPTP